MADIHQSFTTDPNISYNITLFMSNNENSPPQEREPPCEWRRNLALEKPSLKRGSKYHLGQKNNLHLLRNGHSQEFYQGLAKPDNGGKPTVTVVEEVERLCAIPNEERSPAARNAIRRLQGLRDLESTRWTPDLVYKVFKDLDEAIFGGVLYKHCRLLWVDHKTMESVLPEDQRMGPTDEHPEFGPVIGHSKPAMWRFPQLNTNANDDYGCMMSTIRLNADAIFRFPVASQIEGTVHTRWEIMWETLMHEMIHAYIYTQKGSHLRSCLWGDADKDHGVFFKQILDAINSKSSELFGVTCTYDHDGYYGHNCCSGWNPVDGDHECWLEDTEGIPEEFQDMCENAVCSTCREEFAEENHSVRLGEKPGSVFFPTEDGGMVALAPKISGHLPLPVTDQVPMPAEGSGSHTGCEHPTVRLDDKRDVPGPDERPWFLDG
ncbi:hypothetical protein MMC25_001363 [Agyrium rufum]|nr:hypothetical protein [Agyrium rufum]